MCEDAVAREATERRDGERTLSLQIEEVRGNVSEVRCEIASVKTDVAKIANGLRFLKRRVAHDITALTEELAKLNRRALAIAMAAVLAALGSIPEARALAVAIMKGIMSQ